LVVVNELRIGLLGPAPRSWIQLVRKRAHGNGDGHAFDSEEAELVLPVETARGNRRVRQPGKRDVVEDVVSREAPGLPGKGARDQFVAACVVIQKIGGKADG